MDANNHHTAGVACHRIVFNVDKALVPDFFRFLQQGVRVRARTGGSVAAFLRDAVGAGPEAIGKIQSIILDGSPVDDIGKAVVKSGAVLALSAAMPGLVGATLRRGGAYSSFRSAITYHETAGSCVEEDGLVEVKIFNLLMAELGPGLLERGVIVRSEDFVIFASGQPPEFWQGCRGISLDGKPLSASEIQDALRLSDSAEVLLSVSPALLDT